MEPRVLLGGSGAVIVGLVFVLILVVATLEMTARSDDR
jgi:hypothetical protein